MTGIFNVVNNRDFPDSRSLAVELIRKNGEEFNIEVCIEKGENIMSIFRRFTKEAKVYVKNDAEMMELIRAFLATRDRLVDDIKKSWEEK